MASIKTSIQYLGGVTVTDVMLNKNEIKEVQRISFFFKEAGRDYAQRHWDIWARSAPTAAAQERRKSVARALGLSDEIRFL